MITHWDEWEALVHVNSALEILETLHDSIRHAPDTLTIRALLDDAIEESAQARGALARVVRHRLDASAA